MDQHDDRARPQTRTLRGTCITRTVDLANPRLIGVWKWNFEEASRRLYAVCVYAPNVLRDAYPLEELHLKDCIAAADPQGREDDRLDAGPARRRRPAGGRTLAGSSP
jgi:hypothetical protein